MGCRIVSFIYLQNLARQEDRDEGCRLFSLSSIGAVFLGCPYLLADHASYLLADHDLDSFLRLCRGVSLATFTSLITLVSRHGADGEESQDTRVRLEQQQDSPRG